MPTLPRRITGGVDTHLDTHVVAALDELGALIGVQSFETTVAGYREALQWLRSLGTVELVGVEGTGSYGAGLTRHLLAEDVPVVEVDRPNRQRRRRRGKSDPQDAITAARAAQSGDALGAAKTRNGSVEAIRVLRVVCSSARNDRTRALNQMRSLVSTAPDDVREELRGLSIFRLVQRATSFRPRGTGASDATKLALRTLARRVQALDVELKSTRKLIAELVAETAPELLARPCIGPDTASALLVAAGDNPQRLANERTFAHLCGASPIDASSGKNERHRLNRGGDRQANAALWRIVLTPLRYDEQSQTYFERRLAEGLTKKEAIRCLKRYVAREVFAHLPRERLA